MGYETVAGVRLRTVSPRATTHLTEKSPGYVAGHYDRHELDIDPVRL
jgi:hypothetical protein